MMLLLISFARMNIKFILANKKDFARRGKTYNDVYLKFGCGGRI
jgi:hypothetical protein